MLHWIDVAIVCTFVAYALANGLRARRHASVDLEEYFLAGRTLSGWRAGFSMVATQFAADTPLLVTGLVATAGIFALWQMRIYALAFLLMGFVLAPSWRRAQVLTDAELTELRYASRAALALRTVKALYFGTLFNCVVLAWVLFATRTIAEPFLRWHAWLPGVLFDPVFALVKAVGVSLASDPGGIRADAILGFTPSRAKDASLAVLAVFALQWLIQLNADGTGYLAQRSMACRSDRDAKLASVVFTFTQVVLRSLLWLPIALGLLVLYPVGAEVSAVGLQHDREATFVRGMAEMLPVGVVGLMLTAMLGALASTIDTHLNWGASYWTRDLYERLWCRAVRGREPRPQTLVWVARASKLGILVVAFAVMTQLTSIEKTWRVALLLGAGMGPMLVLRWLWWRIRAWGELASIAVSAAVARPLLEADLGDAARLLWMAGLSSAAGIGVSLATPESPETLRRFFERARPPGFWAPVACAAGSDPREPRHRLARGLAAVAVTALCCFCALVGLGSWLAGSPAPVFRPLGEPAWIALLLITAAALVPPARRLGFARPTDATS